MEISQAKGQHIKTGINLVTVHKTKSIKSTNTTVIPIAIQQVLSILDQKNVSFR